MYDHFQRKTSGVCVEVGANNGIDDSTTMFFEQLGWKCILVEPNPSLCQEIQKRRNAVLFQCAASNQSDSVNLYVVDGAVRSHGLSTISTNKEVHDRIKSHGFATSSVQVRSMTLDRILTAAQIDGDIDFVSIDVEGHEYEVLEGFSVEKWKPMILLIEDNSNYEHNTVSNYLKRFGYVRFKRTGVNDWYAHRTSKQLVNSKTRTAILWLILKTKAKNRLRKVSLLLRIRRWLTSKKSR